jgi:nucleotide-binding universal stress UspA family protein
MFRRILVPLDGAAESEVALPPTRTLAVALGAEVVLLRVVPTNNSTLEVVSSEATRDAHRYLDGVASTLDVSPVETEVVVSEGGTADTVAREAQTRAADLIIMATHGRHGLARLLVGSVANGVLSRSHVPVLLVGPSEKPMRRLKLILVPLDGSADSYLALSFATRLTRVVPAAIALLRVVVPLPLWIYDPNLGLNTGPLIDLRWDENRRQSAENELRHLAQQFSNAGIEVGADAVVGEVAPAVADYAESEAVDLIIMSTHTRPGPARALLGSVADGVVRAAHQPVLLVNREMLRASAIDRPAYAGVPTQAAGAQHRLDESP